MATIKTAVSIDENVFQAAEKLASKLNLTRSKLFSTAIKEFIEHYENKKLLENLNKAYADEPHSNDRLIQENIRKHHQTLVAEKW